MRENIITNREHEIYNMRKAGMLYVDIGKIYNLTGQRIRYICKDIEKKKEYIDRYYEMPVRIVYVLENKLQIQSLEEIESADYEKSKFKSGYTYANLGVEALKQIKNISDKHNINSSNFISAYLSARKYPEHMKKQLKKQLNL